MTEIRQRILVWDLPTRLFHWLLAASFLGAWLTSESERLRNMHVVLGYTMLGLVAFRFVWGLIGTRYARFASFPFAPRRALPYLLSLLTRAPQRHAGHNPAGSLAIYAILALSLLAIASGYAADIEFGGEALAELHEGAASAMLGLVLIHIGAVIVSSLIHRENLAAAMLDGYKRGRAGEGIRSKHWFVAAALLLATVGFWAGNAGLLPESMSLPVTAAQQQRAGGGQG
jgi:cytochrome b